LKNLLKRGIFKKEQWPFHTGAANVILL
jgi:hypothetical protein